MIKYNKNNPKSIQNMFGSIATQYDRTNSILSFKLHKYWNKQLAKSLNKPEILLDICSGTGEIAFTVASLNQSLKRAILLDFCQEMLDCAKEKAKAKSSNNFEYICADAQKIPLDKSCVDAVTIAYGIRNVKDPILCFKEVHRLLKKNGTFSILELTEPDNKFLRFGHNIYLKTCLPILGKLITQNQEAYQYLCQSIQNFTKPSQLISLLQKAGFSSIEKVPLTGGIATIIIAKKM